MQKLKKNLNVINIEKRYSELRVLKKISFSIKPGELVVLLGPNGAGKSTLFSIISGLITPDKGDCFVVENSITIEPVKALKGLGIVFQQSTIDTELTILENLLFHARLQGLNLELIKKEITEEITKFNILKKLNNKVKTLSGGEKRKVELIRSILHKPKMLLMDEPTVGLDPSSRVDLMNKIINLKKNKNLSILWATHLVDEAEKADKIIILNKGSIIAIGTPNYLIKKTKSSNLNKAFLKIIESK